MQDPRTPMQPDPMQPAIDAVEQWLKDQIAANFPPSEHTPPATTEPPPTPDEMADQQLMADAIAKRLGWDKPTESMARAVPSAPPAAGSQPSGTAETD